MHTPNKPNPQKQSQRKKGTNTAHCRHSVKQTTQREEKVVENTVPDKNRSGALNAMRSTRRETKDTREVERATRDETETLRTGSQASNARRNGHGTDKKSSEQFATEWKWDCGKASEKRATTKRDGAKEQAGNEVGKNYVSRPQQKLNQTT